MRREFKRSGEWMKAELVEVFMQLANASPRTTKAVFDKFAAPEEYTFAKTRVPVRLAQHEGEKLVSAVSGQAADDAH